MASESYNPNKREIFKADLTGQILCSEMVGKQLIESPRRSLLETRIYGPYAELYYLLKKVYVCA